LNRNVMILCVVQMVMTVCVTVAATAAVLYRKKLAIFKNAPTREISFP